MTRAETRRIFRDAARLIAEGQEQYSCNALERARGIFISNYEYDLLGSAYRTLLSVSPYRQLTSGDIAYVCRGERFTRRDFRVMLLLFAGEVL